MKKQDFEFLRNKVLKLIDELKNSNISYFLIKEQDYNLYVLYKCVGNIIDSEQLTGALPIEAFEGLNLLIIEKFKIV